MPGINDAARPRARFFILFPTTFHEKRVFYASKHYNVGLRARHSFYKFHMYNRSGKFHAKYYCFNAPAPPTLFCVSFFSLTPNYIRFASTKSYSKIGYFQHTRTPPSDFLFTSQFIESEPQPPGNFLGSCRPNLKFTPSPSFYTSQDTLLSELLVGYILHPNSIPFLHPPFDPRLFVHHSISHTESAGTFDTFVKLTSSSPTQSWRNRTTPQTNKNRSPVYPVRVRNFVFLLP